MRRKTISLALRGICNLWRLVGDAIGERHRADVTGFSALLAPVGIHFELDATGPLYAGIVGVQRMGREGGMAGCQDPPRPPCGGKG